MPCSSILLRAGHVSRVAALGMALAAGLLLAPAASPAAADSAGPALVYRLSLPGVATDSAPAPLPGTVTTQHVSQTVDGSLVISGEVHNGTAQAVTSVVVSASANGTTRTSTALADQIAPGGDALFQVVLPGVTDANAAVSVSVVSFKAADTPAVPPGVDVTLAGVRPLTVTVTDPVSGRTTVTESSTVLVLPGVLTNNSGQALSDISMNLGFYDESGNVRLIASTTRLTVAFRDPADRTLQPGQTGSFEVPLSRAAYLGIPGPVRVVAFVSARAGVEAPIGSP